MKFIRKSNRWVGRLELAKRVREKKHTFKTQINFDWNGNSRAYQISSFKKFRSGWMKVLNTKTIWWIRWQFIIFNNILNKNQKSSWDQSENQWIFFSPSNCIKYNIEQVSGKYFEFFSQIQGFLFMVNLVLVCVRAQNELICDLEKMHSCYFWRIKMQCSVVEG